MDVVANTVVVSALLLVIMGDDVDIVETLLFDSILSTAVVLLNSSYCSPHSS